MPPKVHKKHLRRQQVSFCLSSIANDLSSAVSDSVKSFCEKTDWKSLSKGILYESDDNLVELMYTMKNQAVYCIRSIK